VVRRHARDEAQQVVVVAGLDAPRRTRSRGRRSHAAEPGASPVE
jgi:hypothetical protein